MARDVCNDEMNPAQLAGVTPFIVAVDVRLTITWASEQVLRRVGDVCGHNVSDILEPIDPPGEISPSSMARSVGMQHSILLKSGSGFSPLVGQWVMSRGGFILLAKPDVRKIEDLDKFSINDFPENDPAIELLTAREEHAMSLREARSAAKALWRERDFAESLVNTTPAIILLLDEIGRIVRFNSYMEEISGYSLDEVRGKDWFSTFLPSRDNKRIHTLFQKVIADIPSTGNVNPIITKDGKEREIEWRNKTLKDSAGNVTGVLSIGIDITEREEKEKERQMLEVEINQARKLEAVGSLAAGIAHEINTPIQFIGDNTNFLSDAYKSLTSLIETYNNLWQKAKAVGDLANLDSEKVKAEENADLIYIREEIPSAIEQTLAGVQRVTKIVRAMKDFAHSDQGTKSMSNLNEMLESTLTVARNELKYVANVETDFDPGLPNIECYRDDLNQVFLNLLINAAHAIKDVVGDASAGKGTITVSTQRTNDNVIIKISDTGTGIPQAIRDRIFEPFFTTKDVGKGSGQGLAIARKIVVEKHEGSLGFETEEGKGTTFIVSLPITTEEVVGVP
jgi:PAS domain S-box-containing protein